MNAYDDLREAIRSHAFVRASDTVIIDKESTGARASWIFDFRALLMQPHWLNRYAEIFWETFASHHPFQVGGMESASISLVAAIVMKGVERGTPVNGFFVRKSRKRQGLMKQVEGTLADEPIILVDDLINSGNTFNKQLDVLSRLGKHVSDIFVCTAFRDDCAYAFLKEKNVALTSLFTLNDFGLPLITENAPIPDDSLEVVWHYSAPNPSHHLVVQKSAPILDESRIFFGCDDGTFRALDQLTGNIVWEFKIGAHPPGKSILSSPALYDGRVYFGAYDGVVYSLDAKTGAPVWKYDDADWVGSSPALAPDIGLLFIGLEFGLFRKRGGIVALRIETGEEVWRARTPELTHGSPLYIAKENLVVIGSNDGIIYAYDAKNGTEHWKFGGGEVKSSFAYDAKRRLILFGSLNGHFYALNAQSGTPVFARETGAGIYSTPCLDDDVVYAASLDKKLYAIDLDTWKDKWVFETNGRIFASPIVIEESVWIGSNDGRLYEISRESGKAKGYFQTTERIVNRIAYNPATKLFFVPTHANEIYCLRRTSLI